MRACSPVDCSGFQRPMNRRNDPSSSTVFTTLGVTVCSAGIWPSQNQTAEADFQHTRGGRDIKKNVAKPPLWSGRGGLVNRMATHAAHQDRSAVTTLCVSSPI